MTTQTTFVLAPTSTISEAATAVAQGKISAAQLTDWALVTPFSLAECGCLYGIVDPATFGAIMAAQQALIAANAAKSSVAMGQLTLKVGKRGGISLYGLNVRQPQTLYRSQWERLLAYVKAGKDNPISAFIASNPTSTHSAAKDFAQGTDAAYLAEIIAGKHAHASIAGDVVTVRLATKAN